MKNDYVAVIDSGLGGISLLTKLIKELPTERFLYFGDNKNAPYGSKSSRELLTITEKNISYLKGFGLKALVLACNTLSVSIFGEIRKKEEVPVYGVFPPIEKAVMQGTKTLLLATPLTVSRCGLYDRANVTVVPLPSLARKIEEYAFRLEELNVDKEINDAMIACGKEGLNRAGYFEEIILGCTHYFFVKDKIIDHFNPKIISDGGDYTALKVKNDFKKLKLIGFNCKNRVLFVGENAQFNRIFFEKVVKG